MSTYNINNNNLLYYYPFNVDYLDYKTGTGVSNATTTNVTISTANTKLTSGSILFPGSTGVNQKVQIPSTTLTTNGVTIAFWAKITLQSGVSPQFVFNFASGAAVNTIGMWLTGTGAFLLMLYNASSVGNSYSLNYTLADANWHHYCVTASQTSGVWSFYVDGVSIAVSITSYPTTAAMTTPYIGANHLGNANINGNMNQFLVFNRVITATEIGYLVNNPTQVGFSSVVDWVVGGQNTSSIAQILYSTDGKTYTNSSNAADIFGSTAGSNIYGVAHNGFIWVAGGNPTNSKFSIGYSYDGIVWYGSSSGTAILSSIGGVCYGNGKFVASGGGATYNSMYSIDGINWTAGNLLATTWSNYTQHVGFQNSTFVMCGGGGKIAFSSDGINWQLTSASGLNQETNMIDYNSGLWVVAGSGSGANVSSTPSLTTSSTWTTRAGAVYSNRATGVKYGSDKFVLIGRPDTYFYTSTNGTTWTQNTSSTSLFQNSQTNARNKIEWYNGLWIIGQYTFGGSSSVLWSNDGITWNASTVPASSNWVRGIGYALPPPYVIGTAPTITSITSSGSSSLNVYFTPGTGGVPDPSTYYYSTNSGSTYTNANSTTSPILITGLTPGVSYNVAILANSTAGNTVASNISVGIIYLVGTAPTITSITPNGGSGLNVFFTSGTGGNPAPTTYYYSTNGGSTYTNANSTTSPLLITGVVSGVSYNVAIIANNLGGNTVASNIGVGFIPYPCFLEGSKILCLDPISDVESYVPVETLRPGDLVKTSLNGHKAVFYIGKRTLPNPAKDPEPRNRLYRFPRQISPKMTEDLCITGEHCLLHKKLSHELEEQVRRHMGDIYITEYQYRVPACLDHRAIPYTDYNDSKEPVTIWHFALENHNPFHNYGVYANGLLVESCSIQYLTEMANMELVDR